MAFFIVSEPAKARKASDFYNSGTSLVFILQKYNRLGKGWLNMRYPNFETNVMATTGDSFRIVEIGSRTLGIFAEHIGQADKLDSDLSVGYKVGVAAIRVNSYTELKAGEGRLDWRQVDPADIHSAVRSDVDSLDSQEINPLHIGESDPWIDDALLTRLGGFALGK
jgi:hypothetical protein